ncbi:MAG: VOC family protein [Rhodospirillales bacterium]|nr:VOC family protein [Rhodospirillales bacterium]
MEMAGIRIKSIVYPTKSVAAATRFYGEVLGLPVQFQDGDNWAQFRPDGGTLALAGPREQPPEAAGPVVTLEVADLDALRPRLAGAGVRVVAERDMGSHGRTLTIADPDGNLVHLFQRAAG